MLHHLFRGCGLTLAHPVLTPSLRAAVPLSLPLAASLPRHTYSTAPPSALEEDDDSEYFDTMLGKHEFLSVPEEEVKSFPEIQRALEREAEYYMDHGLRGRFTQKIKKEVCRLHKLDPKEWSIPALACKFGVRKIRVECWIRMHNLGLERAALLGEGWHHLYDHEGKVINIEKKKEELLPKEHADELDDRILLRQRYISTTSFSVIDDEADQARLAQKFRLAKANEWKRRNRKMRRCDVPLDQLPEKIMVPKPITLSHKLSGHWKDKFLIIDNNPRYSDFDRPMFLVSRDGTVTSVNWDERRLFIRQKYPRRHQILSVSDETIAMIDAPAKWDPSALEEEYGYDVHGLDHDIKETVTQELDRKFTSIDEMHREYSMPDDEDYSETDFENDLKEMNMQSVRDEEQRLANLKRLIWLKKSFEKYFKYDDSEEE